MAKYDFKPEHYLLPVEAQAVLKKAAVIPDKRARQIAIERAVEKLKRQYPEKFRQ